jgi:hypothetical protein
MATLVNLTNYVYGVASAETSIEVKNVRVRTAPKDKVYQVDRTNNNIGFAVTASRQEISLDGEINAASGGHLANTFTAAVTLGNSPDGFGVTAGGVYMDSAEVTHNFGAFKALGMEFSRDPGIA